MPVPNNIPPRTALVRRFAGAHGLSPRELAVVDLAAAGLCTKQIALHLGCSQHTVAVY